MTQKGLAPILIVLLITVSVSGYLIYQKQAKLTPQPSTQPSPTTAASPPPTSTLNTTNWKEYTNSKLGFSLRYPASWSNPKETQLSTRTQVTMGGLTIEEGVYYDQSLNRTLTFNEFTKKNTPVDNKVLNYTLGGIMGKQFVYKQGESAYQQLIAVPVNKTSDQILTVSYNLYAGDAPSKLETINQILSSFIFTNQTIDTTTYQGEDYSFNFPNTWYTKKQTEVTYIGSNPIPDFPLTHGLPTGIQITTYDQPQDIPNIIWKHTTTDIVIGSIQGTKLVDEEPGRTDEILRTRIIVNKAGKGYIIIFSNTDSKGTHNPIFDQILSTFKFTN